LCGTDRSKMASSPLIFSLSISTVLCIYIFI
jgi:hypothetical protein